MTQYQTYGDSNPVAHIIDDGVLIHDGQSALDLLANAHYSTNSNRFIITKESIDESFFDLRSGLAGEVMQKFINYRCKLAIVGDFSAYTSKALNDFIYECNQGNDFFFVSTLDEAVERLSSAR